MHSGKTKGQKATKTKTLKVRHSTHRELRGRDRRADRRVDREQLVIVLHPALFEQLVAA